MKKLFIIAILMASQNTYAQVGIGNTDPQSSLDISASNVATPSNTDGILIPRIDDFPATNPTAAQDGMMVFTTGDGAPTKGFYYWDQDTTSWVNATGVKKINDLIDGKSDSDGSDDGSSIFLGINAGVLDDSSNNENIGIGYQALESNVSGNRNIAIGNASLQNSTASFSTAIGYNALISNTSGNANLAVGVNSLFSDTTGDSNLAVGFDAGLSNTTGRFNAYLGNFSGRRNITGGFNTFVGNISGNSIRGSRNVVVGHAAGGNQTIKNIDDSVFLGFFAGALEFSSDKLYIENSPADADNALIYGEFDTNILRTNSEFQIGNPTGTGYAFPTTDGTAGQVLTTDGAGQMLFTAPLEDIDWYEEGTTTAPNAITDNIFTQGDVGIGITTPVSPLHIGTQTSFDLDHANIGQDGIFIIGQGDNSGTNAVGGSISFGPPSTTRGHQRKSAIASVQTSGDIDHTGLAFYVHGNAINQSPMVEGMRLTHQRQLGINNNDPSANLDVIGTLQYEDGNEATGFVLASDASGNATWTDPNTLTTDVDSIDNLTDGKSDSDGSEDGSSIFLGISAGAADDSSDNQNIGVGYHSMEDNSTGQRNSALGYRSLTNNITGNNNVAIGNDAMRSNTTGNSNTALGTLSLESNISGGTNVAIGTNSLNANTSGGGNTAVGGAVLLVNTTGEQNSVLGAFAMDANTDGSNNTAMGHSAFGGSTTGTANTAIGHRAMNSSSQGNNNVALGKSAGYYVGGNQNTILGSNAGSDVGTNALSGSIFIGYQAGLGETTSNRLYIENSSGNSANALIYGEFDNDLLRVNGDVGIGRAPATNALEVEGNASKSTAGAFIANSDRRLKKDITTLSGTAALDKLTQLRGVTYLWNDTQTGTQRPQGIQYGFIAQEIQEVFPEKVTKDNLGFYQTAYGDYDALFVQAIKEQQQIIENQETKIKELEEQVARFENLEARLTALEVNNTSEILSAGKE